jgi:hypothetical protein
VDVFADALVPGDEVRRVLVDIDAMPTTGLPDDTGALLEALQQASNPGRLLASLSVPDDQSEYIAAVYPALQVIHQSQLHGLWDVAVASGDTASRTQLIRLNRVSPRWVFTSTGIGAVRNWRTRAADSSTKALLQDSLGHADGIIALHAGVRAELESYAVSATLHLPVSGVFELDNMDGNRAVQEIVERYGRSTVNIERLRARWDYFARAHSYDGYPRDGYPRSETFIRRLLLRAEQVASHPVGYAKRVVRMVRNPLWATRRR